MLIRFVNASNQKTCIRHLSEHWRYTTAIAVFTLHRDCNH